MPTYQYACTDCGERLEVVQSFTAEPLTECPSCRGRLRKVFTPVGVVFKGSGFYKTDSRTERKPAAAKADGARGAEERPPAAAGDAKPAADGKGGAAKPAGDGQPKSGTAGPVKTGSGAAGAASGSPKVA